MRHLSEKLEDAVAEAERQVNNRDKICAELQAMLQEVNAIADALK